MKSLNLHKTRIRVDDESRQLQNEHAGLYLMKDSFGEIIDILEIDFCYSETEFHSNIRKRAVFQLTVEKRNLKLDFISNIPPMSEDSQASLFFIVPDLQYAVFLPKIVITEMVTDADFETIYAGTTLSPFRIVQPYVSDPVNVLKLMKELHQGEDQ